ncbi:MAG TPA: hypothetical protein PLF13_04490 [candidate division Zixibacteria bacterium]|nr:hypothetical protein [candidate division Zixibacteria bacterium]
MKGYEGYIDRLVELLQGKLKGRRKAQLEAEIKADPKLAEIMAGLKGLLKIGDNLRRSDLNRAVRGLSDRLFADFMRSRRDPESRTGIRVFDSRDIPLPEGVRPATVDTRRLRWQLPKGELEMAVYPITDSAFEVIGQVTGIEADQPVIAEIKTAHGILKAEADPFGLFRFERVPRGSRELILHAGPNRIGSVAFDL